MAEEKRMDVSPLLQLMGARTEEYADGYARVSLLVEHRHTNGLGIMHGGVIMALMDEALARSVASKRGIEAARAAPNLGVEMNVSFLRGARPGDEIIVEGRVIRLGRTVAFAEAEVRRRGEQELIAKGRSVFAIVSRRD